MAEDHVRNVYLSLARDAAEKQIASLKDRIDALQAWLDMKHQDMVLAEGEGQEAIWEAAVMAEITNQYILNDAHQYAPVYAALENAAYEAMVEGWES